MYNELSFINGSTSKIFTNMNEALEEASLLVVNPVEATVGDIVVTPEGLIDVGGDQRKTTTRGFESFCKILGIPPKFARGIPKDLLLHNIERLSKDVPGTPITLLERPDGNFASIVRSPYKEIPYADILSRFVDRDSIKNVSISEELMKVMFKFEQLKVPDLDDNRNTLYISEYMLSSLIKEIRLQVNSGLFKTQCENSFIMPILGKLYADYTKGADKRLEKFAQSFECYDNELIATIFRNLSTGVNKHISLPQFKYVWNRYSKLVGKFDADVLFDIDEDRRKALLAEATLYMSQVKKAKALGQVISPPENTPFECYSIANEITTAAHESMAGVESVKAEILGGTILQWMIFLN